MSLNTIVFGASDNPERYSYKALKMLRAHNHAVVGVHPKLNEVEGIKVFPSLEAANVALGGVDTITMYVGAKLSQDLAPQIIASKPRRVIFNPGAENPQLVTALTVAGISCLNDCTLVLLSTGQY